MRNYIRKYVLILLMVLTALLCTAGASTWILLSEKRVPTPVPFAEIATRIDTSGVTVTAPGGEDSKIYYGEKAVFTGAKVMAGDVDVTKFFKIIYGDTSTLSATGTKDSLSANVSVQCVINSASHVNIYQTPADETYTVNFHPVAYYGDTYYSRIDDALAGIEETTEGTLYVMPSNNETETGRAAKAKTITADATIPSGVTLSMPYEDKTHYSEDFGSTQAFADNTISNRKNLVTINENIALTIETGANLYIGGIFGRTGQDVIGLTNGDYSEIQMKANSKISSSGNIKCYGFIKEYATKNEELNNGSMVVLENGQMDVPFTIYDFKGGTVTTEMNGKGICPFDIYDIPNVQSILRISSKANVVGEIRMNMSVIGNIIEYVTIVGTTTTNTALILKSGYIDLKYTPKTAGTTSIEVDGSKTVASLHGVLELGYIKMTKTFLGYGITIDTSTYFFPLSYKFDFCLEKDSVLNVAKKAKFMPGSSMHVKNGATFNINSDVIFYPENFAETKITGSYPQNLSRAQLICDGKININEAGALGADIENTVDGATINMLTTNNKVSSLDYWEPTATVDVDMRGILSSNGGYEIMAKGNYISENGYWAKPAKLIIQAGENSYNVSFSKEYDNVFLNTTYTLTAGDVPKLTKNYYTFDGWYYENGSKAEKGDLVTITDETTTLTLYPKFTPITYEVGFEYKYDDFTPEQEPDLPTQTVSFTVETSSISLPTPTSTLYNFNGWYTSEDCAADSKVTNISGATLLALNNNNTLYGLWTSVQYTVTLAGDDKYEEGYDSTQVLTATQVGTASLPDLDDYNTDDTKQWHFDGWYYGDTRVTKYSDFVTVADTVNTTYTVTAKWTDKIYICYQSATGETLDDLYMMPKKTTKTLGAQSKADALTEGTFGTSTKVVVSKYTFTQWKISEINVYVNANSNYDVPEGNKTLTFVPQYSEAKTSYYMIKGTEISSSTVTITLSEGKFLAEDLTTSTTNVTITSTGAYAYVNDGAKVTISTVIKYALLQNYTFKVGNSDYSNSISGGAGQNKTATTGEIEISGYIEITSKRSSRW